MKEGVKTALPYFVVIFGFFVSLFIIVLVFDRIVLPLLIHNQDTVQMPNLIGKRVEEAEKIITQLQLKVSRISELYSEKSPEGIVINQSPRPGQMVKKGRDVFLTLSKGMTEVVVPDLTGKNIRQARIDLNNAGLEVGRITYRNDEQYGPDTIISQSPLPMTRVHFGKAIDLDVSSGSVNNVKVPYLEGLNLDNAIRLLNESDLAVGTIQYVENQTFLSNTVLHQSITGGALVSKGTKVDLTVVR